MLPTNSDVMWRASRMGIPDLIRVDKLSDMRARYKLLTTTPREGMVIFRLSNQALPEGVPMYLQNPTTKATRNVMRKIRYLFTKVVIHISALVVMGSSTS